MDTSEPKPSIVDGRCAWCAGDALYQEYHDREWGRPVGDDRHLFELVVLEGAQAGLSWLTILRKRQAYRRDFHNFDPRRVASMTPADVAALLSPDSGIVRNRAKILSAITNARAFLRVVEEFGSFKNYILTFFPGRRRIDNHPDLLSQIPASTPLSDAISADLRRRGFKFFGSTICYSFLQSAGFINDHLTTCFTRRVGGG